MGFGHGRPDVRLGRLGKPVQTIRFIAMAKAHGLARKWQGRAKTTISVIGAQRGYLGPLFLNSGTGSPLGLGSHLPHPKSR